MTRREYRQLMQLVRSSREGRLLEEHQQILALDFPNRREMMEFARLAENWPIGGAGPAGQNADLGPGGNTRRSEEGGIPAEEPVARGSLQGNDYEPAGTALGAHALNDATPQGTLAASKIEATKRRGRKSKFTLTQLQKAREMKQDRKSNHEIARELYDTLTPTPDQRRSVPTILKYHFRVEKSPNRQP